MPLDLTGVRFERWTVITRNGIDRNKSALWFCRCDCGTERHVLERSLKGGVSRSCGCLQRDLAASKLRTHGEAWSSPEYAAWQAMLQRCYRQTHKNYCRYGGRGISVCETWKNSFEEFLSDMGRRPGYGFWLERRDNNGNYEPKNCSWETAKGQLNNTRWNRSISIDGVSKTISQWADHLSVRPNLISSRLRRGWGERDAVLKPVDTSIWANRGTAGTNA